MTWLDAVVAAVLISSIIISVIRGLVREILSVLGWIAAFVLANRFAENLAAMLPAAVPGVTVRLITAFAILFIGTLIIAALISAAIGMLLKASGLVLADRGLGGLFGLARGVLIILTAVILAGLTALPRQPFWRESFTAPLAEQAVRSIKPLLPDAWAEHVHY
jgi:membrane protein required for colicin V production